MWDRPGCSQRPVLASRGIGQGQACYVLSWLRRACMWVGLRVGFMRSCAGAVAHGPPLHTAPNVLAACCSIVMPSHPCRPRCHRPGPLPLKPPPRPPPAALFQPPSPPRHPNPQSTPHAPTPPPNTHISTFLSQPAALTRPPPPGPASRSKRVTMSSTAASVSPPRPYPPSPPTAPPPTPPRKKLPPPQLQPPRMAKTRRRVMRNPRRLAGVTPRAR